MPFCLVCFVLLYGSVVCSSYLLRLLIGWVRLVFVIGLICLDVCCLKSAVVLVIALSC